MAISAPGAVVMPPRDWQVELRAHWWRAAGVLLLVLALTAMAVAAPIDPAQLGAYGYLGVFLITLLGTGSFVLPVPYLGAVFVAGAFLSPAVVAAVAAVAAALGEMTGYLLGRTGRSVLSGNGRYAVIEARMARFGGPIVFLASALPNPFFDVVGVIAGATRLPIWLFLVATFLGKSLRFWVIATVGGALLPL